MPQTQISLGNPKQCILITILSLFEIQHAFSLSSPPSKPCRAWREVMHVSTTRARSPTIPEHLPQSSLQKTALLQWTLIVFERGTLTYRLQFTILIQPSSLFRIHRPSHGPSRYDSPLLRPSSRWQGQWRDGCPGEWLHLECVHQLTCIPNSGHCCRGKLTLSFFTLCNVHLPAAMPIFAASLTDLVLQSFLPFILLAMITPRTVVGVQFLQKQAELSLMAWSYSSHYRYT
jgi:hypothetical protein